MLLALWFDFWNPASWTPGSHTSTAVVVVSNSLGGTKDDDYYVRAPEEYWLEREKFLARHAPIRAEPAVEDRPEVKKLVRKYNRIIEIAPKVPDMAHLREMDKILKDIALQIYRIEAESDEEALMVLLLS